MTLFNFGRSSTDIAPSAVISNKSSFTFDILRNVDKALTVSLSKSSISIFGNSAPKGQTLEHYQFFNSGALYTSAIIIMLSTGTTFVKLSS